MHLTQLYGSIITLNGSSSSWVCSLASRRLLFLSCYKFNGIPLRTTSTYYHHYHHLWKWASNSSFKKYILNQEQHYGWFYSRHIDIYFHLFVNLKRRIEWWNWQEFCTTTTTTTISSSKTRMTTMTLDEDFFLDSWLSPISRQRYFW